MTELSKAIELSRMPGVGASVFKNLLNEHKQPSIAIKSFLKDAIVLSQQSKNKASVKNLIENTLSLLKKRIIFGCYYSSPEYPVQLCDLSEPPPVLFSTSKIKPVKYAAVVGARKATKDALRMTKKIVQKLVAEGYTIVSGGAIGIDSCAHREALKLKKNTVAVLGNGIDVSYPKENEGLFDAIKKSGNLISEFLAGTQPHRSFFPTRNRIIAALADVVIVVQASKKSGSMITAKWATKLKRKIVTISPLTDNELLWEGNQRLIDAGAGIFTERINSISLIGNFVSDNTDIFYDASAEF